MKKNILIVILTILAILSVMYAFIKSDEASKAGMEAQVSTEKAEELRDLVVEMQKAAEESAAMAKEQQSRAEQALADCQNK